jgi:anti-sigma regulatory factor (Ser/Thr protein kinase)
MNKSFKRTYQSLEPIYELTEQFFAREAIDRVHLFPIAFAVEELFTNMVKYNGDGAGDIQLSMRRTGDSLVVTLTDSDATPFDVTRVPDADVEAPIEQRRPGGLGLHLLRRLVDDVEYRHEGRKTRITIRRSLAPAK